MAGLRHLTEPELGHSRYACERGFPAAPIGADIEDIFRGDDNEGPCAAFVATPCRAGRKNVGSGKNPSEVLCAQWDKDQGQEAGHPQKTLRRNYRARVQADDCLIRLRHMQGF
jgi:hypothetical protein